METLKKISGFGILLYLLLLVVGYVALGSVPSIFEGFIAVLTISTYAVVVSGKSVQAPNIWFPKFEVPKSVSKLLKRPKNKG